MNIRRWTLLVLAASVAHISATIVASAATLDRQYRMGDDPAEGAVNGAAVVSTIDSEPSGEDPFVGLAGVNSPTYVAISGRPDGVSGRGIQFNAAQMEYLRAPFLGFPETSWSSQDNAGTLDYTGITDRGFEFWARPTSTAVQSLVMDTNEHGVRINSSGRFSMRYSGHNVDSGVTVTPNTWYHLELVSAPNAFGGARLYINGIARAIVADNAYAAQRSDLVVGSNTGGDDFVFTGGTEEFYSGIIDDLEMFVFGTTTSPANIDYGDFNFASDNAFAAAELSGVAGDVNNDGVVNTTDRNAFIAGWMDTRVVNGFRVGDLLSYGQGDLNFDGITDIHDLVVMQGALTGAGVGAITAAELHGVPEPSTVALLFLAAAAPSFFCRRACVKLS